MTQALQVLAPARDRADAEAQLETWLSQEDVLGGRVLGPTYGEGWMVATYLDPPDDPELHLAYNCQLVFLPPAVERMLVRPKAAVNL